MADLEDRFLKKNVPGRYSGWDKDEDERTGNNNDDYDEGNDNDNDNDNTIERVKQWDAQGVPKPLQISALEGGSIHTGTNTTAGKSHNTGAKGVLNDYRQARAYESYQRQLETMEKNEILRRATQGVTLQNGEVAMSAAAVEQRQKLLKKRDDDNSDDDKDVSDDEDEEFFKNYRKNRLKQLQYTTNWPSYDGKLHEITPEEYTSLVDTIDSRVHLIVHLYEPSIPDCRLLNDTLEKCANIMKFAKFVKLRALDAKPNMDCIVLPAILIYRGGDLEQNLVRFTQEELMVSRGIGGGGRRLCGGGDGRDIKVEDVRDVLESYGVVNPQSVESTTANSNAAVAAAASITAMGMGFSSSSGTTTAVDNDNYVKTKRITRHDSDDDDEEYDSDDAELDEFCKDFQSSGF